MANEVSRRIPLDGEEDFLDVRVFVEKGRVVGFVLNDTAAGEETVVCRYDTCHGHLHLHRCWIRDEEPQDLEPPTAPPASYKEKVAAAEADLFARWRAYRAKMELHHATARPEAREDGLTHEEAHQGRAHGLWPPPRLRHRRRHR